MRVEGTFQYLSSEIRPGYKDPSKMCNIVLLMQGTETADFMTDEESYQRFQGIKQLEKVKVVFDYNARFRSLRLKELA